MVLLCSLNIFARFIVAAFRAQTARSYDQAAAACDAEGQETSLSRNVFKDDVLPSITDMDKCVAASRFLEAVLRVLMAFAFLVFFPACIVMFRRVECRLVSIIQEMNLRSDLGTVFLPYEFSPATADGARSQVEMQVVEARAFLGRIKSAAAAQRRRFFLCLVFVLLALLALASESTFFSIYSVGADQNAACEPCGTCQNVYVFMKRWSDNTPELIPIVVSACSTLPLMFSLWLMTTKEDRALMLNPGRFRTDAIALQQDNRNTEAMLKAERVRMGVELQD
jgi:hypothetical protein